MNKRFVYQVGNNKKVRANHVCTLYCCNMAIRIATIVAETF